MFYEIIPSKNHKYESLVKDTLKEYDKFFNVSYSKENFTFLFAKDVEQYRNITNTKADYAIANTFSYQRIVLATKHSAVKFKCQTDDEYNNMLRHEIAHIYMGRYMWHNWCLPIAFNEGFAGFISNQIKTRACSDDICTLFDKNVASKVFYTGGGFFIEYLITTYKKEKFLKFLALNRQTNTEDGWKKHFKSVYKKTHIEILNEMLKRNSFLDGEFSLRNFKKFINEVAANCKDTFSKTIKLNLGSDKINFKIISSQDEMKKEYKRVQEADANYFVPSLYDIKSNLIYFYALNPYKTYFRKQEYISNILFQCYRQILTTHFQKGKKQILPNWLICGVATYFAFTSKDKFSDNVTRNIFNDKKIDKMECASFVKYIVETYKKEKFLKFLKSLENINTKKQVEENFKAIYKKSVQEILKEI